MIIHFLCILPVSFVSVMYSPEYVLMDFLSITSKGRVQTKINNFHGIKKIHMIFPNKVRLIRNMLKVKVELVS